MDKTKIEVFGLWKNETKDGKTYLSGSWGKAKVLVFPNGFKKPGEKSPDYKVYLAPQEPKDAPKPSRDDDESGMPF